MRKITLEHGISIPVYVNRRWRVFVKGGDRIYTVSGPCRHTAKAHTWLCEVFQGNLTSPKRFRYALQRWEAIRWTLGLNELRPVFGQDFIFVADDEPVIARKKIVI